jgi:nitrite reductase/ring-hydroxylating ferredoxin subunit
MLDRVSEVSIPLDAPFSNDGSVASIGSGDRHRSTLPKRLVRFSQQNPIECVSLKESKMAEDNAQALSGPDLLAGVKFDGLAESEPLLGHFDGEPVILVRQGEQVFATGAVCTHYGGPLAEGLVVGESIRCPWHHARFDLRTGEAEGAPALNPVPCFNVMRHEDMVMIGGKKAVDFRVACNLNPSSVVIVGPAPRVLRARICCVQKDMPGP